MLNTYLGFDFGGTKLLIGEVDEQGNIIREKRYPTGCRNEAQAVKVLLESAVDYLETIGIQGNLLGAGVGIVGTVDYENGYWITMHPRITTEPIPLAVMLKDIVKVPVYIDNDVKSATVGELIFGSGKGRNNFVYLNVGTGLAGGFVVDGRILRGRSNNAGEIGHTVIDIQNTDDCICGRQGCIEGAVSGYGFTKQIEKYGLTELLTVDRKANVSKLYQEAEAGEKMADKVLDYAAKSMANLMMNLVKVLDTEGFILGGGCVQDGVLIRRMQKYLRPEIMESVTEGIQISQLNPAYTGLLGAAALAVKAGNENKK